MFVAIAMALPIVVGSSLNVSRSTAQQAGSGIRGPFTAAPSVPAVVDLRSAAPVVPSPQVARPRLHPAGQAELDRAKAMPQAAASSPANAPLAAMALSAGTGVDGISSDQSFCTCIPPDGALAAGRSNLVAAVNTSFKIWDKAGNATPGYPKSLASLLNASGCLASDSDPFAGYDAVNDRFMLGALTFDTANNSAICIAVSRTADPTATWNVYAFPVTPANDLLDFPHAAIGSDAIYLSGNQFQGGTTNFVGARVYAYNKAQMYAGQVAGSVFFDVGNNAAGKPADTLTPALGVATTATAYFLAADNIACPCSNVSLWKWSDPFGASAFALRGGVTVTSYDQPPNAPQLGGHGVPGLIATNDAGNLGARWFAGTVWGTHAVATNPGGGVVAGVHWYEVTNIDASPGLVQQGIVATNGTYRFFPNLALDRAGDMGMAYAESSGTQYASIDYTGQPAGLAPGTLLAEAVLKGGEATVSPSNRYGDYAGEVIDPNGCTFWHFEEYARAGSEWGTWLGSFRFSTCPAPPSVGGISENPLLPAQPRAGSTATLMLTLGIATFLALMLLGATRSARLQRGHRSLNTTDNRGQRRL